MRLHKVISSQQPEYITVGEYTLAKVSSRSTALDAFQDNAHGILIEKEEVIKEILMNDALYLKPLFFVGQTEKPCDASVSSSSDPVISRKLASLLPDIAMYEELSLPEDQDKRLLTKVLRYTISRRTTLQALNTRFSQIGYAFPLLENMSIEAEPLHVMKHLNDYTKQGYFTAQPVDKINICSDCHGSYLNFSECCTKCDSIALKTEELVHHFRCAYVGPQSDFVKDEKLICPKCDHQLKHIGIDYDKPSEIHTCATCDHSSQETKMKATCVDCKKENQLDQLVTYEIRDYKPTEKAKTLASQTTNQTSFDRETTPDAHTVLTPMGAFTLIKSHEAKKPKPTGSDTYDMVISLDQSIFQQLNEGMQHALVEELATIVHPYLKPSDLLAIDHHKNIHALLVEYTSSALFEIQDVLSYNLNKMLRDNGWMDHDVVHITANTIRK